MERGMDLLIYLQQHYHWLAWIGATPLVILAVIVLIQTAKAITRYRKENK